MSIYQFNNNPTDSKDLLKNTEFEICNWTGEYAPLRNDFMYDFVWKGETYKSAQHAFEAAKHTSLELKTEIKNAVSANHAVLISNRAGGADLTFIDKQEAILLSILTAKFSKGPMKELLRTTKNKALIATYLGDSLDHFWGCSLTDLNTWFGHNKLGKTLELARGNIFGSTKKTDSK